MPRRRNILIFLLAAVELVCGVIAFLVWSYRTPEASYQGRSASDWLRDVLVPGVFQNRALEAFRQMGTNADPVLVAAMEARDNLLARTFRHEYPELPDMIRKHIRQPADLIQMRQAAGLVVRNTPLDDIVPKLLPLLAAPDSKLRLAVLQAVDDRIEPPDAGQIPFLLLATNDPDTEVRMDAAWALWEITRQTNATAAILNGILRQSPDVSRRHWAAVYLLRMGHADPLLIPTFIGSLTSGQRDLRVSAGACLRQIGPPAADAVPALFQAVQSTDLEVSQSARQALRRIKPRPAAADSP
jgi:HEAT repeat protein